jgi:hypothetical protein
MSALSGQAGFGPGPFGRCWTFWTTQREQPMSMADRDGKIWMDGKLVEWRDAKIHVLTHTLHYGMGVFEGVRAYKTPEGTAIFRLKEHTKRLFNSAKIFQMDMPFDHGNARSRAARSGQAKTSWSRATCARSSGSARKSWACRPSGNTIHVAIAAWPWGAYLGEEGIAKGIRVKTSSFTRHHVNVSLVRAKASATTSTRSSPTRKRCRRRLRRSAAAGHRRLRVRRLGRELLPGPQRQAVHAGPGVVPRRHHARRGLTLARDLGIR